MKRSLLAIVLVALAAGLCSAQAGNVASKFDIDLYGYIKLDAVYDTQKNAAGDIELFVLPEGDDKDDEFTMTARQTRFGFNIAGPDIADGKCTGRIEAGFWGEESDPDHKTKLRIRLAYADLAYDTWSFRAGQDWDTFITVIPKSINFTYFGWQGAPGYRRAQARLTKSIALGDSCKLTAKVAAARTLGELYRGNDGDYDGDGQNDGEDSGIPSVQGNLILTGDLLTDKPTRISVSGTWGQEDLDTTTVSGGVTNVDVDAEYDTWLVMGSLFMPLMEKMTLQGAVWTGSNLDAYESGLGLGINTMLGTEIDAQGGWGQLMCDVTEKLNLNVGYGLDDVDEDDLNGFAVDSVNSRSKNEFIMASAYYAVNEALVLGFEYSHMTTSYKGAEDAENDRFHGAVFYFF